MSGILVLLLLVVLGVVAWKFALRPHTSIGIERGTARVRRGSPPRGLVSDLEELARQAPTASGEVLMSGRGTSLEVQVRGLDEGLAQRARNVVGLHRARLR